MTYLMVKLTIFKGGFVFQKLCVMIIINTQVLFCIFMCAYVRVHGSPVYLYAFVCFSENAAKVRIALVKSHGLMMVNSLQSRAEQTLSCMQTWLEEHYLAEMKRYGTV